MATYRKIKLNNCSLWLGNTVAEDTRLNYALSIGCTGIQLYGLYSVFGTGLQALLPAFIDKAYNTYGFQTVGAIMGNTAGFNNALSYNAANPAAKFQFNEFNMENEFWFGQRVDFRITAAVVGFTYTISITDENAQTYNYSYTAVGGDTTTTIANALLGQMTNSITGYLFNISTAAPTAVRVYNRRSLNEYNYTVSANISPSVVNLAFKDAWIDTVSTLKSNIGANPWTVSAYIADPLNSWGYGQALSMIDYIDEFECTNYQTTPNERSVVFRDRQLIRLAAAGNNKSKIVKFYALWSAEPAFLGPYLRTNTIESPPANVAAEDYWTNLYSTDVFANKGNLAHTGFVYFDYNNMSTVPAVTL